MNIMKLKRKYDEFVDSCGCEGIVPEISDYVKALEDATRWRDVREELPTADGWYLVYNAVEDCIEIE